MIALPSEHAQTAINREAARVIAGWLHHPYEKESASHSRLIHREYFFHPTELDAREARLEKGKRDELADEVRSRADMIVATLRSAIGEDNGLCIWQTTPSVLPDAHQDAGAGAKLAHTAVGYLGRNFHIMSQEMSVAEDIQRYLEFHLEEILTKLHVAGLPPKHLEFFTHSK